jgi:hypothetical protein
MNRRGPVLAFTTTQTAAKGTKRMKLAVLRSCPLTLANEVIRAVHNRRCPPTAVDFSWSKFGLLRQGRAVRRASNPSRCLA